MDAAHKPDAEAFRFEQSGALLRKVLESTTQALVLVGVDQRLLHVNAAFCEIFGYRREASLQLGLGALLAPEEPVVAEKLARLLAGEIESWCAEARFRQRGGGLTWMMASGTVLRSERTGRPLYVILQLASIDRQKRAEAALGAAENRWNRVLEATGQGLWDRDLRTGVTNYSPTWLGMRGLPGDDYADPGEGKWLARLHPDDRERMRALLMNEEAGRHDVAALEYRERHRGGHYIWVASRSRAVEWNAVGKPTRIVGADTDITGLKSAEVELAAERERFAATIRSTRDGVISTDAKSCIVTMNAAAEQMTGWKSVNAVGRNADEVFAVVDETGLGGGSDPVGQCLAAGRPCPLASGAVLIGRKGDRRGINGTAAPVRLPDGTLSGAVLVFHADGERPHASAQAGR